MNKSYMITAEQLIKFNEAAYLENQNNTLNIQDKNADPQHKPCVVDKTKLCVLTPIMFHRNNKGVPSWRCMVVFGVEGEAEPGEGLLDLPKKFRREVLKNPLMEDGSIGEAETQTPPMQGGFEDDLSDE